MKFQFVVDRQTYLSEGLDPLGLLYIMTAVRDAGHEVRMTSHDFHEAASVVEEWKPDVIGYSIYTGNHTPLVEINNKLKQHFNFISIFGGPHPTFFPEIIEKKSVDIICMGEGEEAIVELLDKMQNGDDYTGVRNFWIKKDGEIFKNPIRPAQENIDTIAYPAREYFYTFPDAAANNQRIFITARGCSYACTYCYVPKMRELYRECGSNYFRQRSVDNVIGEIKDLREKYEMQWVHFSTDNFTTRKDWIFEFAEKYRKEVGLPFTCLTRPETTRPDVCEALKTADCRAMYLGLESGSEQVRREILNRRMTNKQILSAAQAIKDAGIRVKTFNMVGFPGEALEQSFETLRLNQECKSDLASCTIFVPYPRTKLCDYAIEKGYFDGDFDSIPEKWWISSSLKLPHKKEMERLQKLFGIGVEWPWLTPLIKVLMRLPLNVVYKLISHFFWQYTFYFRMWGRKKTPAEFSRFLQSMFASKWSKKFKKKVEQGK